MVFAYKRRRLWQVTGFCNGCEGFASSSGDHGGSGDYGGSPASVAVARPRLRAAAMVTVHRFIISRKVFVY